MKQKLYDLDYMYVFKSNFDFIIFNFKKYVFDFSIIEAFVSLP